MSETNTNIVYHIQISKCSFILQNICPKPANIEKSKTWAFVHATRGEQGGGGVLVFARSPTEGGSWQFKKNLHCKWCNQSYSWALFVNKIRLYFFYEFFHFFIFSFFEIWSNSGFPEQLAAMILIKLLTNRHTFSNIIIIFITLCIIVSFAHKK